MRKIILSCAIALTSLTMYSQTATDVRGRLVLGLKAGVNYSNVYDSRGQSFDANPKLGFAGGGFLAIPIGKLFGIQPEIMLSQKGFQSSGNILGSYYNVTRTSTYLDIPLLFAFKPSEFLSLFAGPQLSYLLKQKNTFKNGSTSVEREIAFDKEDPRKNTLGFAVGADLTLKHFLVSGRIGWDIQQNNPNGTSSELRYKNVVYQVSIGHRFYSRRS
ncbi:hypothetical protein CNR22_23765 [Sphingobacteriaceae bacterium]|nr:hypothetical protein CNR22_23765 [Sphingobacteriaceae bacterium]